MKATLFVLVGALSLGLAVGVGAQEDPALDSELFDIENMPTPTTLAELLPEGGIDQVLFDDWMVTRYTGPNGGGLIAPERLEHRRAFPEDGRLVFETLTVSDPVNGNGYRMTRRWVYSADLQLETYEQIMSSAARGDTRQVGTVEGDHFVIRQIEYAQNTEDKEDRAPRSIPLADLEGKILHHWRPLVYAYHLRNGSLGYDVELAHFLSVGSAYTIRIEDVGTQAVEVDGHPQEAHVLVASRTIGTGRHQREHVTQMLMLSTGEYVSSFQTGERYRLSSERITREEAIEMFALDEDQQ